MILRLEERDQPYFYPGWRIRVDAIGPPDLKKPSNLHSRFLFFCGISPNGDGKLILSLCFEYTRGDTGHHVILPVSYCLTKDQTRKSKLDLRFDGEDELLMVTFGFGESIPENCVTITNTRP